MPATCFVIKCGGSTLSALPEAFYEDMSKLQAQGTVPVIVHGGGPAISSMLDKLGVETEFVEGLRRTDESVLDVVEMVLCGQINKQIVRRIQKAGGRAVGICGEDAGMIEARPVPNSEAVGYVGEVVTVQPELVEGLIGLGFIPVVAPLAMDRAAQRYNVNADTAAGAVASHLGAERMIVVTDVAGILKEVNGRKQVLPSVTVEEIHRMIESGDIYGGMIPKVRAAMQCIQGSMQEVLIVDGSEPNVLLRAMSGEAIGTRIVR